MLTLGMVCAAVVLSLTRNESSPVIPQTPWLALVLFGFFLGLAVLAKGPAAIILCGGTVFFWALFTKRWRAALRLFHPAALASFCLTALPWYILCARRNPDFFHIFIIEHNFKRYFTPEFQHIQPFWFYIPILALGLLPWSVSAIGLLRDAKHSWKEGGWPSSPGLFFTCWAIFPLVFFSLSKSKLPGYVLPAVPPLGLLMAQALSVRANKILPGDRWVEITSGVTLLAIALLTALQFERTPLGFAPLIIAVVGFASLILNNLPRTVLINAIALIVVVVLTPRGNTREILDGRLSARAAPAAAAMIWKEYSPERSSTYKLRRSFQYSLNFYFHRELPGWSPAQAQPGWVYAPSREISALRDLGLNCPFNALRHAVIVCEDPGSANRRPPSGQPQ